MIDENYLKTARECTAKFTIKNYMKSGEDKEIGFHAQNFSIAELIYNGEYRYLKLYRVVGSGDDYLPHANFTINDALVDPQPTPNKFTFNGETFTRWCRDIVRLWDLDRYPDLNALKDPVACWASQGLDPLATIEIYRYNIDDILPYNAIVDFWDLLDFTDASGEGLYISGYGNYPINTQLLDDIDYTSLRTSAPNGGEINVFEIPEYAGQEESEPFYFNFYVNNTSYALGKRSDYVTTDFYKETNAGFMYDGNPDPSLIAYQIIGGVYLENLREVGNYHKFRGIVWDVYLDGNSTSQAITIVPNYKGTVPERTYAKIDLGYCETVNEDTFENMVFDNPVFSIEFHTDSHDLTRGYVLNVIDAPPPKESIDISFRYYYIDMITGERHGEVTGNIPAFLPDSIDNMPPLRNGRGQYNTKPDPDDNYSTVIYHFGLYDGDKYIDTDDIKDDIDDSNGYNGVGLLTTQYAMTSNRTQQLGWKLWGASFVELIEKVNNNPIENVISLKVFPFDLSGTEEEVKLGNVGMDVNGERIDSENYNYRRNIGTFTVRKKYNSFLDFAPFTKLSIWLPFIGLKDLDASFCMGKTISLRYIVDIITGACKAELRYNGAVFQDFEGSIGIDIALAASNRAQVEAAFLSNTVSSITRNAGQIVGGLKGASGASLDTNVATGTGGGAVQGIANIGADLLQSALNQYHTTTSGAPSPACSAYQTRDAFLIYDRPTYQELKAFNRSFGRMCMLSRTLGNLTGFTQTSGMVDLSGIPCLEEERERIRALLSSGITI